jgi:hypothetical protein
LSTSAVAVSVDKIRSCKRAHVFNRPYVYVFCMHVPSIQVWELGAWFMRTLLGPLHDSDIARFEAIINDFIGSKEVMRHLRLEKIAAIITDATAIITILHTSLSRRVPR